MRRFSPRRSRVRSLHVCCHGHLVGHVRRLCVEAPGNVRHPGQVRQQGSQALPGNFRVDGGPNDKWGCEEKGDTEKLGRPDRQKVGSAPSQNRHSNGGGKRKLPARIGGNVLGLQTASVQGRAVSKF